MRTKTQRLEVPGFNPKWGKPRPRTSVAFLDLETSDLLREGEGDLPTGPRGQEGTDTIVRKHSFRAWEVAPGPEVLLVPAGSTSAAAATGKTLRDLREEELSPSHRRGLQELRDEVAGRGPDPPPPPRSEPILTGETKAQRAARPRSLEEIERDRRSRGYAIREAKDFLLEALKSGPVSVEDLLDGAREAGISRRTLYRAKDELEIWARRDGGRLLWHLRDQEAP